MLNSSFRIQRSAFLLFICGEKALVFIDAGSSFSFFHDV